MIVTCVYVHVKNDEIDNFIKATVLNRNQSVKEPGNLRFDLLQQDDDPRRFMLYEAYESEESAAAHKNTSHYLCCSCHKASKRFLVIWQQYICRNLGDIIRIYICFFKFAGIHKKKTEQKQY